LQVGAYSASRAIFNPKQIMHPEAAEASAVSVKQYPKSDVFELVLNKDGIWKWEIAKGYTFNKPAHVKPGFLRIGDSKQVTALCQNKIITISENLQKYHSLEKLNAIAIMHSEKTVAHAVRVLEDQALRICELPKHVDGHKLIPALQQTFLTPEDVFELSSKFDFRIIKPELIESCPELADKPLHFDYTHLFSPDIRVKNGKIEISGYHHDAQNVLETNEHFTMTPFKTKELPEGFYQISISALGSNPKSTVCFPKHWTREKVMNKIEESITNGTIEKTESGRLSIIGMIEEGIKIRSIIDPDTGLVISAYPFVY
jgi:hypothetical protein